MPRPKTAVAVRDELRTHLHEMVLHPVYVPHLKLRLLEVVVWRVVDLARELARRPRTQVVVVAF